MADIKRKILPVAKIEKSKKLMGQMRVTRPKTKVVVIIIPPIKFPKIIQS